VSDLGDLANVPKRIRTSLSEAPAAKVATALAAGLFGAQFFKKKSKEPGEKKKGWIHLLFPDFDLKDVIQFLLKSYLEPEQVDLKELIQKRLREFLK